MTTQVRVYLCAVPPKLWESGDQKSPTASLHSLVEDALAIEGRLPKGVNREVERNRYALCCSEIESLITRLPWQEMNDAESQAWEDGRLPVIETGEAYLDLQALLLMRHDEDARRIRLGASFYTPGQIQAHLDGFRELVAQVEDLERDGPLARAAARRIRFVETVCQLGWGLVEVQSPFHASDHSSPPEVLAAAAATAVPAGELEDEAADGHQQGDAAEVLRTQIEKALRTGGGVNLSNQPHNVISEVLRDFAFDAAASPASVRVVYTDGSEAAPFPLRCLRACDGLKFENLKPSALRIALISMRHLHLDRHADMTWLRNREASKSRTLAEADAYCFERSRQQFRLSRADGDLLIYLLQTGFQPAVVAFYRALVEELLEREDRPLLGVVPCYYSRRGIPQWGTPWY